MLEKILRFIEKFIPRKIFKLAQPVYHFSLAYIGACLFRFPSKEIKIVAVTGTKGKTTTTEILNAILEQAGYKTALQNSIRFKINDQDERNMYKMSMPGRFFIHKFLRKAVTQKCDWAVLEITSEAARFFRHKYVDLDALIFTNLAPEHIESHGSYEAYREAKLSIADNLKNKENTKLIVNKDDKESEHFLKKEADQKIFFSKKDYFPVSVDENGIKITIGKTTIFSKLRGEFNLMNILGSIAFAKSINIEDEKIKAGIEKIEKVPGRVEKIPNDKNIEVYVDYAHTKESLESLYKEFSNKKLICVLGNTGGGRDTWKRGDMAKIADDYCSHVILTNEDPYDEDPQKILEPMIKEIEKNKLEVIMDRRMAISSALKQVRKGEVVLITGKGTDPYIMEANGKKTPWSDADVVREEIEKL